MISGETELGRDRYRVGRVAKMFYKVNCAFFMCRSVAFLSIV